jgi:radical SAM superfamily enzyme YgiQ (UPF0313 family)
VIAGGYHPTLAPEEVIAIPAVDIVSRGEGELTLRDLINGYTGRAASTRRSPASGSGSRTAR